MGKEIVFSKDRACAVCPEVGSIYYYYYNGTVEKTQKNMIYPWVESRFYAQ